MADILMANDIAGYNADVSKLNAMIARMALALAAYNALGLAAIQNTSELREIFTNPKGLVFDKITGGSLSIGAATVDRNKAIDLITKPDGYEEFLAASRNAYTPDGYAPYASLDITAVVWSSGAMVADPALLTAMQEQYKSYAKTPYQKKIFEQTTIIAAALNEIANTSGLTSMNFKSNPEEQARFISEYLQASNGGIAPNAKRIAARAI